jgi:uncharacterized delta-60 repeat protein
MSQRSGKLISLRSASRRVCGRPPRLVARAIVLGALALALAGVAGATGGNLDPTFGTGGKVLTDMGSSRLDIIRAVTIQPNHGTIVAGFSGSDFALARYKDGILDSSFGSGGKVVTDLGGRDELFAVLIQADGKIVATGISAVATGSFDFAIARYNENGTLDPSFGTGGIVLTDLGGGSFDDAQGAALQRNGKIVLSGLSDATGSRDFALARYNSNGSLDSSFGSGGFVLTDLGNSSTDTGVGMAIQSNGKLVVSGFSDANGSDDFALARYNENGTLDPSFGSGGKVLTDFGSSSFDNAYAVSIRPNGKIVVVGHSDANGSLDFALARYNIDGSLDPTFGSGGKVLTDFGGSSFDFADAVAIQRNGKIVAAGDSDAASTVDFALARYNENGTLDSTFGSGGRVLTDFGDSTDFGSRVAIQPNGKIVAAGSSCAAKVDPRVLTCPAAGNFDFALARYLAN